MTNRLNHSNVNSTRAIAVQDFDLKRDLDRFDFENFGLINMPNSFKLEAVISKLRILRNDLNKHKDDKDLLLKILLAYLNLHKYVSKNGIKITDINSPAAKNFVKELGLEESVLESENSIREMIKSELWKLYTDIKYQRSLTNIKIVDHDQEIQDMVKNIRLELASYTTDNLSYPAGPGLISSRIQKARKLIDELVDPDIISEYTEVLISMETSLKSAQSDREKQKLIAQESINPEDVFKARIEKFEIWLLELEKSEVSNLEKANNLLSMATQLKKEFGKLYEPSEELSRNLDSVWSRVDKVLMKKLLAEFVGFQERRAAGVLKIHEGGFNTSVAAKINTIKVSKIAKPHLTDFYDKLIADYLTLKIARSK
jgi:hypothetical protein